VRQDDQFPVAAFSSSSRPCLKPANQSSTAWWPSGDSFSARQYHEAAPAAARPSHRRTGNPNSHRRSRHGNPRCIRARDRPTEDPPRLLRPICGCGRYPPDRRFGAETGRARTPIVRATWAMGPQPWQARIAEMNRASFVLMTVPLTPIPTMRLGRSSLGSLFRIGREDGKNSRICRSCRKNRCKEADSPWESLMFCSP